jgi:VCBS repeat-containing protein
MLYLQYHSPVPAKRFIALTLLLIGISGCGGGGGGGAPIINLPPVANNACISTPSGTPISNGMLSATDPNNQTLTYALVANGAKGNVTVFSDGRFTYSPNTNLPANDGKARGMDTFTFRVTDPLNETSTGTMTVLIDDSANPGRVRIMPLGDSITAGDPINGNPEALWVSYRRKLYNELSVLNPTQFGFNFVGTVTNLGASANPPLADRDNEGHDGWRDDEIVNGTSDSNKQMTCFVPLPDCNITGWLNSTQPDVILLHIGTNGINDIGGTSAADVAAILDRIKTWETANSSPVTVFLARIIGSPNATTNTNVTAFNNNVAAMAQARIDNGDKIFIVNQQTGALLNYQIGAADGSPSGPDMGDNLHPNQDGYEKMGDKWKTDIISSNVLPSCP